MAATAKLMDWVGQLTNMARRKARHPKKSFRPSFDILEDRRLLAILYVDDDLAQKPNAQFTSIQAAVNAANPGDIVRVSPGTYEEAVVVGKRLTILGPSAPLAHATNPNKAAIVDVPAGSSVGFSLTANDIALQGFTIGDLNADGLEPVGVLTANTTQGNRITGNVIQQNSIGIYLNSAANAVRPTLVTGNVIRDNNAAGPAGGTGIYSDQGLVNATIVANKFSGHENTAINLTGGVAAGTVVQTRINVVANQFTNDAAIALANTTNSTISANSSKGSTGSGIFLAGGNSNITIVGNSLLDGAFTGINVRTDAFGKRNNLRTGIPDSGPTPAWFST